MTLLDVVRVMRRNLLALLLGALIGVLLAAAWTLTRPTTYHAQSVGIVVANGGGTTMDPTTGELFAQSRAEAYLNLLGTRAVAERVTEDLAGRGLTPGSYNASTIPGTGFINMNGVGSTSEQAQGTADAALRALAEEALRMETYGKAAPGAAKEELERLTNVHLLPYEAAVPPQAPSRPGLLRNFVAGAAAGLLAALLYVIVRKLLDVRIRTTEEVEQLTGRPVLGIVPEAKDLKRETGSGLRSLGGLAGEAIRKLRTNLRFVHPDDPLKAFVVTSANPGEGKSTVASQLARLTALAGRPTVIIDCDLRRPVQNAVFNVDASVGLSQVLAGDVAAADAIVPTTVPNLRVLPAGRIPPNPSELLGSRKMVELLDELSQTEVVILDAPPMLAVTDAALLAAATDGALFVTSAGRTPKEQVKICAQQLEMVRASLLGTVLNRVTRRGLEEVAYGYGYGYGYRGYASKSGRYYSPAGVAEEPAVIQPAAEQVPAPMKPRRSAE